MFQDMQIPAMVSTDQKVVDTLDELIEDLKNINFTITPNPNTTSVTSYSVRGNGIINQFVSLVGVLARTYSDSDLILATDNNKKYVKLATTNVGNIKKIINNFDNFGEGTRVSIGTAICFRKYTIPNTTSTIQVFETQSNLYFLRGARVATNPDDDEVYLVAQNLVANSTDTSYTLSYERYYQHIPFILSQAYEHLPEEI